MIHMHPSFFVFRFPNVLRNRSKTEAFIRWFCIYFS